jgi:hypothetical protein
LNELEAYAAQRVRELSGGALNPALAKPSTIRSFSLARQPPADGGAFAPPVR